VLVFASTLSHFASPFEVAYCTGWHAWSLIHA
jgi:hypothetical protein